VKGVETFKQWKNRFRIHFLRILGANELAGIDYLNNAVIGSVKGVESFKRLYESKKPGFILIGR
jgi:hypothetical protein